MDTLQEESSNCQAGDPYDVAMDVDSGLRFPLDGLNMVFTGHYNGFGVEVRSDEAIGLLYHMGCFGKGSMSRSKPNFSQNSVQILRRRQYLKRSQWFKKYAKDHCISDADRFIKDIEELSSDILNDVKSKSKKDVIDLISSEDSDSVVSDNISKRITSFHNQDSNVVVVPNSESEDDNYFANLKPECCLNKTKLEEKLLLTAQEAFFLMYGLGCLQIVESDQAISIEGCWRLFSQSDPKFIEKYVIYHYFRSKGYVVKPGIKFGGDYLLYKEGPEVNHAAYIVIIRFNDDSFDWISILGHVRVANTTSKQVLIAEVIKPNKNALQLPQGLGEYSVREVLLDRNIPVTINDDTN